MIETLNLKDFVNFSECLHREKFIETNPVAYLGSALGAWLERLLDELGVDADPMVRGTVHPAAYIQGRVFIDVGALVEPTAMIQGPCYIGPGTEVRHGAYIRGMVYAGRDCVIGHTTEVKGSLFFDEAKAGHFAYVGDSILGRNVNLGAGTKLANLPLRRGEVRVRHPKSERLLKTGLHKFGALLGDDAQTGCNAVLSPGTLLMPKTAVLPCVHYRGTLTEGYISKSC